MNLWPYFYEYLKINSFFAYLAVFLGICILIPGHRVRLGRHHGWILAVILLIGLCLRIGWLNFSTHEPMMERGASMLENDLINVFAIDVSRGIWFVDQHGMPSGRRPIGYPMLLGLLYKLFGIRLSVVWITQLVLYVLGAWLIYGIAKEIFSSEVGLIACFFYSIYPVSIYSIRLITDEHLFLPLWYLGIYLLVRESVHGLRRGSWFGYGVIFGLAAMTRTHAIMMPLVVGAAYAWMRLSWRKVLLSMFLVAGTMQLVNLPWIVRNYRAWGVLVPYTATGSFVYAQVNSTATPDGQGHIPRRGEEGYSAELEAALNGDNPGRLHQLASRQMWKWIVSHPARFSVLGIGRVLDFMHWNRKGGVWPIHYQYIEGHYNPAGRMSPKLREAVEEVAHVQYYILLHCFVLALIWMWVMRRDLSPPSRIGLVILLSCIFLYLGEHMIIYPFRKYRFPIEPLMMVCASYLIHQLAAQLRVGTLVSKAKGAFRKR